MRATRLRRRGSSLDWALLAAVAGALIPVVVAAAGRIADRWQPADDEAAIARLAHDVFTGHTPLLGMPSTIGSGVESAGGGVPHHLGPMLFWLFAVPDRVTGSSPIALMVTIALLNMVAIAAVAWQVRRRAGSFVAIVAMLGLTVMLWRFGRDLTVQMWNPYAALLPFLLFLVLAWSVAAGDHLALPLAALAGSFVVQCHIIYALPVVGVSLVSLAGLVISERADRADRARRDEVIHWPRGRRRALVATVLVLAVCWSTAVYDQLIHRPGNLTRLWNSLRGSHQAPLGLTDAIRYVARAVAIPPLFARRIPTASANTALVRPLGLWVALSATAVIGLVVAMTITARRRSRSDAWLGVLALVVTALSILVLARLPIEFGGINIYRDRFIWIVGFYVWLSLGVLVGRELAARLPRPSATRRSARIGAPVTSGAAALLAVVTVVSGVAAARQRSPAFAVADDETAAVSMLSRQVRANVTRRGPYLLQLGGTRAILTVGFGVMWNLVRHGYDVRVRSDDAYLGNAHGLPERARVPKLLVVSSARSFDAPPGAVRVASYTADPSLPSRLVRERAALVARLDRNAPGITAAGRTVTAGSEANEVVEGLRSIAAARAGSHDWRPMLDNHLLRLLVLGGLVALPARDAAALVQFDDLLNDAADAFVSVFVVPPPT